MHRAYIVYFLSEFIRPSTVKKMYRNSTDGNILNCMKSFSDFTLGQISSVIHFLQVRLERTTVVRYKPWPVSHTNPSPPELRTFVWANR